MIAANIYRWGQDDVETLVHRMAFRKPKGSRVACDEIACIHGLTKGYVDPDAGVDQGRFRPPLNVFATGP